MNQNNKYSLSNINCSINKLKRKSKKFTKDPLPNFLIWLKEQINSEDKRFSLHNQKLILYKLSECNFELIFILPEVLEIYYQLTGVAVEIMKTELKKALKITHAYTILKEGKIIEVFPCKKYF
ncbi:hypothetical protein ACNVED_09730 [Legionella sp. D16C41]|uniref:hypothetical protein n=1 Tax=Legionella sp. D16C41 TaxID=3402688 RepID=UPI003AF57C53